MRTNFQDIINSIYTDKRVRKYLIVSLLLLIPLYFIFQFFSKGDLLVTINGPTGSRSIVVSKIETDSSKKTKEINIKSENAKFKLSAGEYRVQGVISQNEENSVEDGDTPFRASKTITIKPRSTTKVNLDLVSPELISVKSSEDEPVLLSIQGDEVSSVSRFGLMSIYRVDSSAQATVRKEPAFLRNIVGLCTFSNKNKIALTAEGSLYNVSTANASPVDLSLFTIAGEVAPEFQSLAGYGFLNESNGFVCLEDRVIMSYDINISNDLKPITDNPRTIKRIPNTFNAHVGENGDIWLYTKVSPDNLDLEGEAVEPKTLLTRVSADGQEKSVTVDSSIADISTFNKDEFCYYFDRDVNCGNIGDGKTRKVFSVPENRDITNLQYIGEGNLVYTFNNSAWVHNINDSYSKQIYVSGYTILPNTLSFDGRNQRLTFGTELSQTENSSNPSSVNENRTSNYLYQIPIISTKSL